MPIITYDSWDGLDLRFPRSLASAKILFELRNCYITTGHKIRKRPGLVKVATLEAGTVGLKAALGKLNTFYADGTITHADTLFVARKVTHPSTGIAAAKVHYATVFNGFIYAAVEYVNGDVRHHYLDGTSPTHIADVNCPNTKQVEKIGQKIYAASGGNVRFSAVSLPRNWTLAGDAGFLPSGIHAAGQDTVTALGEFNGQLVVFFSDSIQVWTADPDPAKNALQSTVDNVGTAYSKTPISAFRELMFLAQQGFRSVGVILLSSTFSVQENDVGSQIDPIRSEILVTDDPISVYYPDLGQVWFINGSRVYQYSFSKNQKLTAWAINDFPFSFSDAAVLAGALYLRSGNDVYRVDQTVFADDGLVPLCEVEMYYQDSQSPGILKMFTGFDGVVSGSPDISFRFDPRSLDLITAPVQISGDLRPGDMNPMEICATSVAPVLTHQRNEAFEVGSLMLHYENLGPV